MRSGPRTRLAIHQHLVGRGDVDDGRVEQLAVEGDAAFADHPLDVAARGDAGAGQHLGNALRLVVDGRGDGRIRSLRPGGLRTRGIAILRARFALLHVAAALGRVGALALAPAFTLAGERLVATARPSPPKDALRGADFPPGFAPGLRPVAFAAPGFFGLSLSVICVACLLALSYQVGALRFKRKVAGKPGPDAEESDDGRRKDGFGHGVRLALHAARPGGGPRGRAARRGARRRGGGARWRDHRRRRQPQRANSPTFPPMPNCWRSVRPAPASAATACPARTSMSRWSPAPSAPPPSPSPASAGSTTAPKTKRAAVDNGVRFFSRPHLPPRPGRLFRLRSDGSQRDPQGVFPGAAGGLGRALIENPTGWVISKRACQASGRSSWMTCQMPHLRAPRALILRAAGS